MKTYSKVPSIYETQETVHCPLCGRSQFSERWKALGARFVTCSCGLVLQNPRPISSDLAARYDEEYFQYEIVNEENFFHLMLLGLKDASFFQTIVPSLPPINRILDIGCATGRLLSHFNSLGWETAGVELCAESAAYGNEKYGVGILTGDLYDIGFPDGHFSVVHASHLIEHVDNPVAFTREIFRIIDSGGVFICITPAIDGFQARLFGSKWRSAIPDHVTLFSKKTLKCLLLNAGFTVEAIRTWGGLAAGTAPPWLKTLIDQWVKVLGWGDVMLMVARK